MYIDFETLVVIGIVAVGFLWAMYLVHIKPPKYHKDFDD